MHAPTPVILDTDIGLDVDDVWALAFLLRCPELDLRMVVSDSGNTHYGARLAAKLLTVAGREDVAVGIGIPLDDVAQTHAGWLGDYALDSYRGAVHADGVGAMCDMIMRADEPVTVISIGPVPNIAAALARTPAITNNSRFVGMHGSLRRGYLGVEKPMREYNVKKYPLACQRVFATPWNITITPLDSCGVVRLEDDRFSAVRHSTHPLSRAVIENHFGWFDVVSQWPMFKSMNAQAQSSILYDTVAVYLAFAEDFLHMEDLRVIVSDDGKTLIDPSGQSIRCATGWRDLTAFLDLLTARLT
ncbi:MAG: nucleoside hydrolase [Gammaproteobacteria bacterium]|nr:nucleoside hydrolase [Gammaproteobacteria bacterium]